MSAREFCTVTASTRRAEALAGGVVGAAVDYLEELLITPLWPVTPDTVASLGLNSPREFKEAYHVPAAGADLPDVVEGDLLVVEGEVYIVDSVAEWVDGGIPSLHIVAQQVKRQWPAA